MSTPLHPDFPDWLIDATPGAREEVAKLAAQRALAAQERASAAWETFKSEFADREEAYRWAGSPGLSWKRTAGPYMVTQAEAGRAAITASLQDFDTRALGELIQGIGVVELTLREQQALDSAFIINGSAR